MTKKEFLDMCDLAIASGLGVLIKYKIEGRHRETETYNYAEDVLDVSADCNALYDENMKLRAGGPEIISIAACSPPFTM